MANETPDWLKGHQGTWRENPARWRPGQSGNPSGRPLGSKNKKTLVIEEFEKAGSEIAQKVVEAAKAGDITAANIVLQRLSPPLRPRSERVKFELDATAPLYAQGQQIMKAVAASELDPETGKLLIECLNSFAGLRQVDDLAARLDRLEGKE